VGFVNPGIMKFKFNDIEDAFGDVSLSQDLSHHFTICGNAGMLAANGIHMRRRERRKPSGNSANIGASSWSEIEVLRYFYPGLPDPVGERAVSRGK
jgi:hypothetical protein